MTAAVFLVPHVLPKLYYSCITKGNLFQFSWMWWAFVTATMKKRWQRWYTTFRMGSGKAIMLLTVCLMTPWEPLVIIEEVWGFHVERPLGVTMKDGEGFQFFSTQSPDVWVKKPARYPLPWPPSPVTMERTWAWTLDDSSQYQAHE